MVVKRGFPFDKMLESSIGTGLPGHSFPESSQPTPISVIEFHPAVWQLAGIGDGVVPDYCGGRVQLSLAALRRIHIVDVD
jgi:hypothetical protein